ncbi:pectate lyase-domain-containing protein [Colletotrichum navitas]|uniref:Probable pectate lyase F n=1 Tax=Colletotrichum navitas TaxID=681940 RepID=A0AAD8Q400_9PEZI|nr:pectate lyase-domain-containing protein [Colletotrichum navitas]KAK1594642.1 pectate lyase-domain-containing protein [Colletotrichum navitas]
MQTKILVSAMLATLATAQTLNIPTRSGSIVSLSAPSVISGSKDFGNKEFDRGRPCDTDDDTGSESAVFILENGATLSNVIIGANQLEGVHCKAACTLKNVWFRDVCEDAISALGTGNVLIQGGGAQNAIDKVVQHNGRGTVTIDGFTVVTAGKLYRGCGDCTNNGGPRNVVIKNVKAKNVKELVGINSNYGDVATISGTCGSSVPKVCQEYKGVNKGSGSSTKVTTTANCKGYMHLFPEPSKDYALQSLMGSQISFGPGAEIMRFSLPNDFTAIRIWNIDEEAPGPSFWENLKAFSGYDAHQHKEIARYGTVEGVRYIDVVLEDAHFAQNICQGFRELDREMGTTRSQDLERIPSYVSWRPEQHVGFTEARTVRLTWNKPRKNAHLIFFDRYKAEQLTQLWHEGQIDLFGGSVHDEPLPLQNSGYAVRLRGLPLNVTQKDIRSRIPKDLMPNSIICGPEGVYGNKEKCNDLTTLKNLLDTIGWSTVELLPEADVPEGMVCATARFDFEEDARRAVGKLDLTAQSFVRYGILKASSLYTAIFCVPKRWMSDPLLQSVIKRYSMISFKMTSSSDDVIIKIENTDSKSVASIRRVFVEIFGGYHRMTEDEEHHQFEECCRPQDSEAAVSSESECPVCTGEPSEPVRSACGHVYCKQCYVHMVESKAKSGTESSLKCIGGYGACQAPLPLSELRGVLQMDGYRKLLESVAKAHVRKNPFNYRSCPTPKCQQLYRPTPRGANINAVARCPDCFVVLCTACHEPHDETVSCKGAEETATTELMATLNIKGCPRCNTFIERTEGCNHIECGCCHAHICWVCMKYYLDSLACYEHMAEAHGGAFAGIPGYDVYGERVDGPIAALPPGVEDEDDESEDDEEDIEEGEIVQDNEGRRGGGVLFRA